MNLLDLVILIVLAGGLALGLRSGMVKQIASIVGLVLAFILGVQFMGPVGDVAAQSLGISATIAPLIGFGLVFLAIQVGIMLGVRAIEGLIGALKLTFLNRLLGGVVGMFKGALALSIAFLALIPFGLPAEYSRSASSLYGPVMQTLPGAWNYMSERFPDVQNLSEYFRQPAEDNLPPSEPDASPSSADSTDTPATQEVPATVEGTTI